MPFCYSRHAGTSTLEYLYLMPRVVKVNHIGVATESIKQALSFFSDGLGLDLAAVEDVDLDCVRAAFLPLGACRVELLEPLGEEGPVQKFLGTRGPGVHHICLEVEDLAGMLTHLAAKGVELIDSVPRTGAHGSLVAFVHPRSACGVLIELVESASLADGYYS